MTYRNIALVCLSVGLLSVVSGCKPKMLDVQEVEGVVTLDGVPLDDVTVTFVPVESGNMGFALTDRDGRYRLSALGGKPQGGTTIGEYYVAFDKTVLEPSAKKPEVPTNPEDEGAGALGDKTRQLVPKKYLEPTTSGFKVSIEKGKNVHDFELKSK